jgi:hypothetical protein
MSSAWGVGVVAAHGDVHFVEQAAQQLFAVFVGGGRRRPHAGEIVAEGQDHRFLVRGKGFRSGGFEAGEFGLSVGAGLQRGVPFGFQAARDQAVVGVDGAVAAFGATGPIAGLLDLSAPLRERGVVAVLELLGGGQARLQRGGLQRGQERLRYGGVDGQPADAQMAGAFALDQRAGAGAVVAGGGFGRAVVVDGQFAPAGAAGGQALQQGAALADRAGAGLVRLRSGIATNADLVGLEGIPVDEPAMVLDDEDLPFTLRQLVSAHPDRPVGIDAALLAGATERVGARVGGVGEHVVHRAVGRLDPGDLLVAGDVSVFLQREFQPVVAQPQPHSARRTAHRESFEYRGDHTGYGFIWVPTDFAVVLAPDQAYRFEGVEIATMRCSGWPWRVRAAGQEPHSTVSQRFAIDPDQLKPSQAGVRGCGTCCATTILALLCKCAGQRFGTGDSWRDMRYGCAGRHRYEGCLVVVTRGEEFVCGNALVRV